MSGLLVVAILSCFVLATQSQGHLGDDPCRMMPYNTPRNSDETTDVTVPSACHNGTFDWDYPQGQIKLHFPNPSGIPMFVCFKDSLGGDVFALYDITGPVAKSLGFVERGSQLEKCTAGYSDDIVVRLEAPEIQYYMGEVAFKVNTPIIV